MEIDPYAFRWPVPAKGFYWSPARRPDGFTFWRDTPDVEHEDDPVLVPSDHETREYEPLRIQTGLFRVFANTRQTAAGVLEFANRFGSLAAGALSPHRVNSSGPANGDTASAIQRHTLPVESLSQWLLQIRKMQAVDRLWQLSRGDRVDLPKLVASFDWSDRQALKYPADESWEGWRLKPIDRAEMTVHAARDLLSKLVSDALRQRAQATLALSDAPSGTRSRLILAPQSLLGALWLQLAEAIASDRHYRACALGPDCEHQQWFSISPGGSGRRADAVFCSGACKSKDRRINKLGQKKRAKR